ncbi:hypothetical protein AB0D08_40155 [Kitasatospora sp. NPDC048540]|uniref:hypothetical protein n=1 Tax=unclassified Kitasatospora TaxID=2633591 RepID=UPI000A43FB80|nr:hypothetical protein [Kitasatospora sp. MBT63]
MTTHEDTAQPDQETHDRSAEERNVITPTPADVRAKAEDHEETEAPEGTTRSQ